MDRKYCVFQGDKTKGKTTFEFNGVELQETDAVIHLGHKIYANNKSHNLDGIISSFYKQFNVFMAKLQDTASSIKAELMHKYCSSFYGFLLLPLTSCLDKLQVTWRKALRRVWRLPNRTHCSILRGLHAGLCDKHMFVSRFARFVVNALDTGPPHVKYIFKKALKIPSTLLARNTWLSCNVLDVAVENLKNSDIPHMSRAQCHRECKPLQRDKLSVL